MGVAHTAVGGACVIVEVMALLLALCVTLFCKTKNRFLGVTWGENSKKVRKKVINFY
jgi:hypothetical protein